MTLRRLLRGLAVVIALGMLAGSIAISPAADAALTTNTCKDDYWKHTLRCQLFPNKVPQANYGTKPTSPANVKAVTRVFLDSDLSIRSVDGTLPVMYVDRAVCTQPAGCNGVRFGKPIVSDRWLFSMTGGGSCYVDDPTVPGVYDDPSFCLGAYVRGESGEMGTSNNPPMKNLFGINSPYPARNPVFASFNRVRIEKSSFDRYMGRATFQAPGGAFHATTTTGRQLDFNLYQHGFDFMLETIRLLEPGLSYKTWVVRKGRVRQRLDQLPPLTNATDVLFVGHSGGAHGLYHNIDRLADRLAYADVRGLFDANFEPGVQNEAAFGTNPISGDPLGGNAYTNQWQGKSSARGESFLYDGEDFNQTGVIAEQLASWDAPLDQSCLAVHAGPTEWSCSDRMHVLMNHIETPIFVRQDWNDRNHEHTNGGNGYIVSWGNEGSYSWCPGTPCLPIMSLPEREVRLAEQAARFITDADTDSELGSGVDPSLGGDFPTLFVWMPDCASHNGAYDDSQFFDVEIDTGVDQLSMREFVEQFMASPLLNAVNYRAVNFDTPTGTTMTQVPCP